ncbi:MULTISPECIES: GNAT family N-acetyltransferase [Lactobacillaceae]|uniref:GNAT family N-acetyltransferase n=1 Tax=Lactobacillaceae TaxID=33958 RepID=UPI0014569A0D|nr:GNAT family protein [Lactobacillus sp. HBUAS51381]NLR08981.1 GNAT family N-acetyltransferase [Lactobacillus sp. HBUAS51381]
MTVTLAPLTAAEAPAFWQLAYSDPQAEWCKWNGPYFHDAMPSEQEFLEVVAPHQYIGNAFRQIIRVDGQLVGSVSAYYEDGDLRRWLDVGIVIYATDRWQRGIGKQALTLWLDWLWQHVDLPHIGLTTWSGNVRMCRLAESLGLTQEARVRQVRYWQGRYWDSVKYGCLREEWATRQAHLAN